MKVDIEADICVLTSDNLQKLGLFLGIKPCCSILKGYGGNAINNLGATNLRATFKDKLISTKLNIVEASGHPSMIGCQQAQELGTIIVNIQELSSTQLQPTAEQAFHQGSLSKTTVLTEYQDCFDKIGRFPGDKYHIQLIDNHTPVVHPSRTVPVHILPLYKGELEKMIQMTSLRK